MFRELRQEVFFFWTDCRQNQLTKQIQTANVAVIEAEWLGRECLDQSNYALLRRERDRNHGAGPEVAAGFCVYPRIIVGIVAAHGLSAAQARAGKTGVWIQAYARGRRDAAHGCTANDSTLIRESDGNAICASDG